MTDRSAAVRGTVAWITIAPVKSLALVPRETIELTRDGAVGNRRLGIVDARGEVVSGKRLGPLVQVVPILSDGDPRGNGLADEFALRFPNGEVAAGPIGAGPPVPVRKHGREVGATLVSGPFADALSAFARQPLRLVRFADPAAGVDRGGRGGVSLVSTAALDALATAAGIEGPVDGRRFRMLFGVAGIAAHAEDSWLGRPVRVGEAVVVPHGNVGRCAVTTQNPLTGVRDLDTLRAIGTYRADDPATEPLPFGIWGEVVEPGRVRLGDVVEPG